jgi:hypothetical protein
MIGKQQRNSASVSVKRRIEQIFGKIIPRLRPDCIRLGPGSWKNGTAEHPTARSDQTRKTQATTGYSPFLHNYKPQPLQQNA